MINKINCHHKGQESHKKHYTWYLSSAWEQKLENTRRDAILKNVGRVGGCVGVGVGGLDGGRR